jgi:D-ribose pyranase
MKEIGILNRNLDRVLSKQGHGDLLLVTDAGFAIPEGLDIVDISLDVNQPQVLDVLHTLKKVFSVEKMIMANETKQSNPSFFDKVSKVWGEIPVETVDHVELKELSKRVKGVIRSGDFTAFGNVILVSGSGDRWYSEKN